jgi:hypothetical protein
MNIKTSDLVCLGERAASTWDERDRAQTALDVAFGTPFEAAKDNLLRDITIAESSGVDLSIFKFPDLHTNIVVRITRKPTPHTKLEKLAEKVAKLEQELKVAKMQLKHTAEQLVAQHECDEVTDKITLAFTRLK